MHCDNAATILKEWRLVLPWIMETGTKKGESRTGCVTVWDYIRLSPQPSHFSSCFLKLMNHLFL